jgi:hypothetical protein
MAVVLAGAAVIHEVQFGEPREEPERRADDLSHLLALSLTAQHWFQVDAGQR